MKLKLFKPDFKNDRKGSDPDYWLFNRYMKNNKLKQALNDDYNKKHRSIKVKLHHISLIQNEENNNKKPELKINSSEDTLKSFHDSLKKLRKTTNTNSINVTKGSFMITQLANKLNPSIANYSNITPKIQMTKRSHQKLIRIDSFYQDAHSCLNKSKSNSNSNETYGSHSLLPNVFPSDTSRYMMSQKKNSPKRSPPKPILLNHSNVLFDNLKKKHKFYLKEDNFFDKDIWKMVNQLNSSHPSSKNLLNKSIQRLRLILDKEKNHSMIL